MCGRIATRSKPSDSAPTGLGASKVPSLCPAVLPRHARSTSASSRVVAVRRDVARRVVVAARRCVLGGAHAAALLLMAVDCPDKRRAPAESQRLSRADGEGQRGGLRSSVRDRTGSEYPAHWARCRRRRDMVLAPRPPSVAAERGGTTATVEGTTRARGPPRCAVSSAHGSSSGQASASACVDLVDSTAPNRQRRDHAGDADVVRAQPPERRGLPSRGLAAQLGPVAVGERAEHVHVLRASAAAPSTAPSRSRCASPAPRWRPAAAPANAASARAAT